MNDQTKQLIDYGRHQPAAENYLEAVAEFKKYKQSSLWYLNDIGTCLRDLGRLLSSWPANTTALLDVNNWNFQKLIQKDNWGVSINKPRIDLTAEVTSKDNLTVRWHATGQQEQLWRRTHEELSEVNWFGDEEPKEKREEKISESTLDFKEHFANWANQTHFTRPDSELLFIHEIRVVNLLIDKGDDSLAVHIANCVMSIFDDIRSFLENNFTVTQINDFEFTYDSKGKLSGWQIYGIEERRSFENEKWLGDFAATIGLEPRAFIDAYFADDRRKTFSGIGKISERVEANRVLRELKQKSDAMAEVIDSKEQELTEKRRKKYKDELERQKQKEILRTRDDWTSISKEELTKLVWSKPATDLSVEFGVSDVAIGKKCKQLGIPKPPLGFWAKVKAGKLPHPRGIVQT